MQAFCNVVTAQRIEQVEQGFVPETCLPHKFEALTSKKAQFLKASILHC